MNETSDAPKKKQKKKQKQKNKRNQRKEATGTKGTCGRVPFRCDPDDDATDAAEAKANSPDMSQILPPSPLPHPPPHKERERKIKSRSLWNGN